MRRVEKRRAVLDVGGLTVRMFIVKQGEVDIDEPGQRFFGGYMIKEGAT